MFCFPRVRTSAVSSSQDLELSQYLGVVLPGSGVNARDTTPIKTVKINESSLKCEKEQMLAICDILRFHGFQQSNQSCLCPTHLFQTLGTSLQTLGVLQVLGTLFPTMGE